MSAVGKNIGIANKKEALCSDYKALLQAVKLYLSHPSTDGTNERHQARKNLIDLVGKLE